MCQIDALAAQLQAIVGDAADVEQVVHEPGHQCDLTLDHLRHAIDERIRLRAAFQERHRVADRCQRIAQFVRERRQELVLAPIGVPQRLEELFFGELTRVRPAGRSCSPPTTTA